MRKDLLDKRFGKLTVIGIDEERTKDNKVYWWCQCDCGYENDRDYNAAMNIRDCGTRLLAW